MKKHILYTITFFVCLFLINTIQAQLPNWVELGPVNFPANVSGQINGIGRVEQIKFDPVQATRMYAVTPRAVFRSNDTATTWSILPGVNYLPTGTSFASICIDYSNNNILYLGGGDANYYSSSGSVGIWKSTDGGASFSIANTGMGNRLVLEIIMSPLDHNVLVAATNAGLYKTTDAGITWTLTSASVAFSDMEIKPGAGSQTLYAVGQNNEDFYRSTDFGSTWTVQSLSATLPSNGGRIAVTAADPNRVYVGYVGSNTSNPAKGGVIYQSLNSGTSFTLQKDDIAPNLNGYDGNSGGQGGYNWDLTADPLDANTIYTSGHIIWKSVDSGNTWTQRGNWWSVLHTDMHHMLFNPANHNQLFNANDGGVWINRDHVNTISWLPKSDGIAGTEFYSFGNSHQSRNLIGGGTQDNGEVFYKDNAWKTNRGGDWGSRYFFDATNAGRAVYVENGMYRNLATSPNGSQVSFGVPATVSNNDLYVASQQDANVGFYMQNNTSAAVYGLYRTANMQATTPVWTAIGTIAPASQVMAMAVSPADANIMYILQKNRTVSVSSNALSSASFTNATASPGTGNLNRGGLALFKSGVVYLSADGYVYRSADQGSSWVSVGSGPVTSLLNGQRVLSLIADTSQAAAETIYAVTAQAVYYKKIMMADWAYLGAANLPTTASITAADIFYDPANAANSALRISTYGRGMWECPLTASSFTPPLVSITSPSNGGTALAGSNVEIQVDASDIDAGGSIVKVEFFNGNTKLGEDLSAPFSYTWNNVAAGGYTITAKATDNTGQTNAAIASVQMVVDCPGTTYMSKTNMRVFYFDSQETSGENGRASNLLDDNVNTIWHTQWSGTVAPLPHEVQVLLGGEYTVNSFKYLPRQNSSNGTILQYELYVSTDSLNWGSPVSGGTFARDYSEKIVSFAGKKGRFIRFRGLTEYNGNQWSSGAEIAVGICGVNQPPTVSITSPANNASFVAPATITIDATTTDADGTVSKVEFYNGATKLGEDLTAPYSFVWNAVTAGSYALTVKATDNSNNITTSSVVNITVADNNTAPTVSISSPANNASFTAPATVSITANAADTDGTVSKVEFYNGSTKLGEDLVAPYSFNWTNVAAGFYTVTVKATDDGGAITTSTGVSITVNPASTTVGPTADSYVRDGNQYKNANYGTATTLELKKDVSGQNREVYLRFNLSGITGSYNNATLRLNVGLAGSAVTSTTWQVYYVSADGWSETSIKWNNKPVSGALLATIPGQATGWAEWNISSQVLAELAADKVLSLRIVSTSSNANANASFVSRESTNASLRPQIVLQSLPAAPNRSEMLISKAAVIPDVFDISVWPNPSRQDFSLDIKGKPGGKVFIRVSNADGKLVKQMTVTTNQVVRFGNNFEEGIYFVEVSQGNLRKLVRLMKI